MLECFWVCRLSFYLSLLHYIVPTAVISSKPVESGPVTVFCFVVTRVDNMLTKDHRKHHHDIYEGAAPIYNVVSSENSQKLTLKLSKTRDEPRGTYLFFFVC